MFITIILSFLFTTAVYALIAFLTYCSYKKKQKDILEKEEKN